LVKFCPNKNCGLAILSISEFMQEKLKTKDYYMNTIIILMIRYTFKNFDFETVYEKFPLVDIIEDIYNRYGRAIPLFYW
jgi:hypothetical protein